MLQRRTHRYVVVGILAVARHVGGRPARRLGSLSAGQHDGRRAVDGDVAVQEADGVRQHARVEVVLFRQGHIAEVGLRIQRGIPSVVQNKGRHMLSGRAVLMQVSLIR